MPNTKAQLLRYLAIDRRLNRFEETSQKEMMEAVQIFTNKTISKRTLQDDLQTLRTRFEAPISKRPPYRYERPYRLIDYLSQMVGDDIPLQVRLLSEAYHLFRTLDVFDITGQFLQGLMDMAAMKPDDSPPVIDLDFNPLLRGKKWLNPLFNAIVKKQRVRIKYKPFTEGEQEFAFDPLYLREFNNRWFCFGMKPDPPELKNLALDRIRKVRELNKEQEKWNLDIPARLREVIGVTLPAGARPVTIRFFVSYPVAWYIRTKPLHHSQKLLSRNKRGMTFSIKVVPNNELYGLLRYYTPNLVVLGPEAVRSRMQRDVREMWRNHSPEAETDQ